MPSNQAVHRPHCWKPDVACRIEHQLATCDAPTAAVRASMFVLRSPQPNTLIEMVPDGCVFTATASGQYLLIVVNMYDMAGAVVEGSELAGPAGANP
jgi:hypothetical protein